MHNEWRRHLHHAADENTNAYPNDIADTFKNAHPDQDQNTWADANADIGNSNCNADHPLY